MLVAILPAQKVENPMLYRVIATVLQTVSPIIMGTLTSIMSSILIGPGNRFQGKLSEIADDVYALIYELHLISPTLMQGILPSLAAQLRCEDDATRSKVVQLLSKVYLTEGATYHDDFPQYFRDFIGRMNDALPSIRNDLIDYASILISRKIEVKYVTGKSPTIAISYSRSSCLLTLHFVSCSHFLQRCWLIVFGIPKKTCAKRP